MFCSQCGKKVPDGTKICPYCGQPIMFTGQVSDGQQPSNNSQAAGQNDQAPYGQPFYNNGQSAGQNGQNPYGQQYYNNGQPTGQNGQNPYGQQYYNNGQPAGQNGQTPYGQQNYNNMQRNMPYNGAPQMGGQPPKKKKHHVGLIILVVVIVLLGVSCVGVLSSGSSAKKVGEVESDNKTSTESSAAETEEDATSSSKSEATSAAGATSATSDVEVKDEYHVGDVLQDGNEKITYVASGTYNEDNEYMQPQAGNKFVFLKFAFENISESDDVYVSIYDFTAYADGYQAEMHYTDDNDLSATLSPGRGAEGSVIFEVPENATDIEVEYETNFITEEKIKFVFDGDKDSGYVLEGNTEASEDAHSVGETIDMNGFKITYVSCEPYTSDNEFIQPEEGHHFMRLTLDCANDSDEDQTISILMFNCYADGKQIAQSFNMDDDIDGTISPGHKISGTVTFEVPDDATTVEAEYTSNVWTSEHIVFKVQ